jgi:hypothetical protein
MAYDPNTNGANRAVMGQGLAAGPLMSSAVQNPAMTSPMAGFPGMGPAPASPGVGASQGSVALGEPQAGAFGPMLGDLGIMQPAPQLGGTSAQGAFGMPGKSVGPTPAMAGPAIPSGARGGAFGGAAWGSK